MSNLDQQDVSNCDAVPNTPLDVQLKSDCGNQVRTPLVEKIIMQCGDNFWGESKQFSKSDWKYEVENDDTVLGYWEWVISLAESNGVDLKSIC